jgi:hypothetical protein
MDDVITVRNKLEVHPGNNITIPGCEPVSSLTSTGLLKELQCSSSVIPVKDVLRAIPGSKLVKLTSPTGQPGTGWWLELPSGPPPDGQSCDCVPDWYSILKSIIPAQEEVINPDNPCSSFVNFTGCVKPKDSDYVKPFRRVSDPEYSNQQIPAQPSTYQAISQQPSTQYTPTPPQSVPVQPPVQPNLYEKIANKNIPNGYAGLDKNTQIKVNEIPVDNSTIIVSKGKLESKFDPNDPFSVAMSG